MYVELGYIIIILFSKFYVFYIDFKCYEEMYLISWLEDFLLLFIYFFGYWW